MLVESRRKLKVCLDDIISRVETGINTEHIEALLKAHRKQSDLVTNYSETLDKLYEKEIKSLIVERERQSSESDNAKLSADVETLSGCVNIGLRSGDCDTEVLLQDNIFETLVEFHKTVPFYMHGWKKFFSFWDRGPKTLKFSASFALFQVEYLVI